MAAKTHMIHARIDPRLKRSAEAVFWGNGVSLDGELCFLGGRNRVSLVGAQMNPSRSDWGRALAPRTQENSLRRRRTERRRDGLDGPLESRQILLRDRPYALGIDLSVTVDQDIA